MTRIKEWWSRISRRRRLVIIIVPVVVAVIAGSGVALWNYHEQPSFCATCHVMETYLESWESPPLLANAHAEADITCLECHEPTIGQQVQELWKNITGNFEQPLEQRDFGNEFCLKCHEPEVFGEAFPHMPVDKITCGSCHNAHRQGVVDLASPITTHSVTGPYANCLFCHGSGKPYELPATADHVGATNDTCLTCHKVEATPPTTTPPTTTPPTTTPPFIFDPDMDCTTCHVMTSYVESLQDATLLAYVHAQEGLACLDCHELAVLEQIHEGADPDTTELKERKFPMEFCFACHTSYPALIELTKDYIAPAGENINPHDTHEGELECYTCHKMHKKTWELTYCYNCHHERVLECGTCH